MLETFGFEGFDLSRGRIGVQCGDHIPVPPPLDYADNGQGENEDQSHGADHDQSEVGEVSASISPDRLHFPINVDLGSI